MSTTLIEHSNALVDFIEEALESLHGLPEHFQAYRQTPTNREPINAVFRAVHSIKGCASFLNLDGIRMFSHALENTLDKVRTESIPLAEELEHHLIAGFDRLEVLLLEASGGRGAAKLHAEDLRILESARLAAERAADALPTEAALSTGLESLIKQIDAGKLQIPDIGRELRRLLNNHASPTPAPDSNAASSPAPAPEDYREACFVCRNTDVTDRGRELVAFFIDFAEGRNGPERESAFLTNIQSFTAWADQEGVPDLAR
ncbi:MAG: Hpt domain-containing protein, partial [Patescibacteria group bacterium]|nr:Hpt domain-containing protein [Patescibacteria group bacterium]